MIGPAPLDNNNNTNSLFIVHRFIAIYLKFSRYCHNHSEKKVYYNVTEYILFTNNLNHYSPYLLIIRVIKLHKPSSLLGTVKFLIS